MSLKRNPYLIPPRVLRGKTCAAFLNAANPIIHIGSGLGTTHNRHVFL